MKKSIVIHWFRQDLRLSDNPALSHGVKQGWVLPIYILDDETPEDHAMGGASRLWLHHSLAALNKDLGGNLSLYSGHPQKVFADLQNRFDVKAVTWNRCYEPWRIRWDAVLKEALKQKGMDVQSFNGSLLWEPWDIKKDDGTPYRVFTPFYKKGCLNAAEPRKPLAAPKNPKLTHDDACLTLKDLDLLPEIPWHESVKSHWAMGEKAAQDQLAVFLEKGIHDYKVGRDFPAKNHVSRLSPHLHFGEISPNQVWHRVRSMGEDKNMEHFCSELGWREFSYHLLYTHPDLPKKNLQSKFNDFPWKSHDASLKAWQRGQTGIPMVDAGMRELWQTGYVHNRVRMIVGSFLVKNLRLHWHEGEKWFWDCLVDADLANNSASWQWIAGCGADAAPYFRIFNPVTQAQKFDPDGAYVRRFVPELKDLETKYLFDPWEAPKEALEKANITLGKTYPHPIVDLKASREQALEAFQSLKQEGS